MDTLIVILVGIYLFAESFTAINEMPKIRLRDFFKDLRNFYAIKYLVIGCYGLLIMYHSRDIKGWYILLTIPAILCVVNRTAYRLNQYTIKGQQ